MTPHVGTPRLIRVLATLVVAVLLFAGCSASTTDAGGETPTASTEVEPDNATDGTVDGSVSDPGSSEPTGYSGEGEPAGPVRDELHGAIATWYYEEGPSGSPEAAECVADAMLDSASAAELAERGVTIGTIEQLYYAPLFDNEPFFDRLLVCGARFG